MLYKLNLFLPNVQVLKSREMACDPTATRQRRHRHTATGLPNKQLDTFCPVMYSLRCISGLHGLINGPLDLLIRYANTRLCVPMPITANVIFSARKYGSDERYIIAPYTGDTGIHFTVCSSCGYSDCGSLIDINGGGMMYFIADDSLRIIAKDPDECFAFLQSHMQLSQLAPHITYARTVYCIGCP
jgi:hypothetical protein